MAAFVLDSDVIIAFLRGQGETVAMLRELEAGDHNLAISTVGVVEVMAGVRPEDVQKTRTFLDSLVMIPLEEELAYSAADLIQKQRSRGHVLPLPDAVIAATALHHQATLLTYNVRHYQLLGLRLESP